MQLKNSNKINNAIFITVLIMELLSSAEIDLFVPSFPDLQDSFNVSVFMVELLLGINLIAHCFTALIVGNLGDRYGRKLIINIGLVIFIVGSLLCIFAPHYYILLFGRFIQGIGISAVSVLGYVVLADLYSVKDQQYIIGYLGGISNLGLAFAPLIGSYVNLFFGWHGNFVILLILGVICLLMGIKNVPQSQKNYDINISIKEYFIIFKSKKAIYYIITIIFIVQAYWVFIAISPILYMKDLGVSIHEFGLYQGAIAAVYSVVSFGNNYLIKKFGIKECFFFSILLLIAFIIATIALILLNSKNPLLITLVTLLSAIGMALPCNILWPRSLEAVPNSKARITAIYISGRLIVTSLFVQLVSFLYQGSFKELGIVMCISLTIGLIACYKLLQEDRIFD